AVVAWGNNPPAIGSVACGPKRTRQTKLYPTTAAKIGIRPKKQRRRGRQEDREESSFPLCLPLASLASWRFVLFRLFTPPYRGSGTRSPAGRRGRTAPAPIGTTGTAPRYTARPPRAGRPAPATASAPRSLFARASPFLPLRTSSLLRPLEQRLLLPGPPRQPPEVLFPGRRPAATTQV